MNERSDLNYSINTNIPIKRRAGGAPSGTTTGELMGTVLGGASTTTTSNERITMGGVNKSHHHRGTKGVASSIAVVAASKSDRVDRIRSIQA